MPKSLGLIHQIKKNKLWQIKESGSVFSASGSASISQCYNCLLFTDQYTLLPTVLECRLLRIV